MSFFVADCDALNFVLVHLSLSAEVRALLVRCGGQFVTLERVYKREAQQSLRKALDPFIGTGLCELALHPSERKLDKTALLTIVAGRIRDVLRQHDHAADAAGCEAVLRERGSAAARICAART